MPRRQEGIKKCMMVDSIEVVLVISKWFLCLDEPLSLSLARETKILL